MTHEFSKDILAVLTKHFGDKAQSVFDTSPLIQYLNVKTKSANRGSKSRSSFGNLYAVYVLVEDYLARGYAGRADYKDYEGAKFTSLFKRQRELPFGQKLQNHQLNSRLYMDFLRMEGEFNFLVLLPEKSRQPIAEYWYRGAPKEVTEYVYGRNAHFDHPSGIVYKTNDPQAELYGMLRTRLAPVIAPRFELSTVPDPTLRRELQALNTVRGASLAWMPELVFLRVDQPPAPSQYFSVLRNTAHKNVAHMFMEAQALLPAENTLTVVPGFIGAYPNAIFRAERGELPALAKDIGDMASEADYRKLADRYAIRRTNPRFWAASDELIDAYAAWAPIEAGLFDYGRLENR
jgi:hypothetical protein